MRHLGCLAVLVISALPLLLWSAPVPERKNAKPAVISASTELWIRDMEERIPILARYAFVDDKKAQEMAIIRKHLTVWKSPPKKEWDAFDKWLKKNIRIERVKGKKLVRVGYQEGNAEEQSTIINVVVDFYLKDQVGRKRDALRREIKLLRDLKERNRRDPTKTEKDLAETDKHIKKREKDIRDLPKIVERAKAR